MIEVADEYKGKELERNEEGDLVPKGSKPGLCLDFDGVIHSYSSGWQGMNVIPDPPVPGAFEFLREAIKYFEVSIFSTRSGYDQGLHAMRQWFYQHDWPCKPNKSISNNHSTSTMIPKHLLFPTTKPIFKIALDDRVMLFNGNWPEMETLINFKPWYNKPDLTFEYQGTKYQLTDSNCKCDKCGAQVVGASGIIYIQDLVYGCGRQWFSDDGEGAYFQGICSNTEHESNVWGNDETPEIIDKDTIKLQKLLGAIDDVLEQAEMDFSNEELFYKIKKSWIYLLKSYRKNFKEEGL